MSIKGYKVFNPDWTCRGFQYEVGKTFKHDGNIRMCDAGFHFCQKLSDCFSYYDFDSNNKVAEVEAIGHVQTEGGKSVTDEIVIVRELTWYEVLDMCNSGSGNTGIRNSGNYNSGNHNSGTFNSGTYNSGYRNSGNWNAGDCNSGNHNSGNHNSGTYNSGTYNSGNWNTGDCNSSTYNSGDHNSGYRNSGDHNSSAYNSGDHNSGYRNSGTYNSGNWNSGDCNSGDWNSGDWNSASYSTGFFNSVSQPLYAFNKPVNISRDAFIRCKGYRVLTQNYANSWWICSDDMTDAEKATHPEHETTGGYLKVVDFKTACKMMWEKLDDEDKQAVREIPNFDAEVFKEITGIEI